MVIGLRFSSKRDGITKKTKIEPCISFLNARRKSHRFEVSDGVAISGSIDTAERDKDHPEDVAREVFSVITFVHSLITACRRASSIASTVAFERVVSL